ncbi:uncharacterized protein Dana_GF13727 [Drosophila ananassae]|uniref:DUF4097 domain-containing protein n=1 Tax=Drosophila ananassae TaxID=7217 RepID=B3MHH9_DROAN|nr:uncharacterized protein LOC6496563 [Drosophila ananassae]EDV37979.1 uncharacterized protein Dana_GF13727 [Drosophila ananassae]
MLLQRLWLPHLSNHLRQYAKKSPVYLKPKMTSNKRMVHQEILRYVNPYARIKVASDIFVRIQPADVHQYTSGDVFIAQLQGGQVKNSNVSLDVKVENEDKEVNVKIKKLTEEPTQFECHLQIPVRSDVCVEGQAGVRVENTQSELLKVNAKGGIITKNVKATKISLYSENGNINCQGTLLGKITEIETHNGNISMDKLQGDNLNCSTKAGSIITDCCYVEKSKFQTETGRLELKNVHKTSEVHVHKSAELNMTGVHGNLQVVSKGGSLNLQLSELEGHSKIEANNLKDDAVINISQTIEQDLNIEISASKVSLEKELEHVMHALSEDKNKFLLSNVNKHRLLINSTGEKGVRLGKQSWSDMMRQKLQAIGSEIP